MFSEPCQYKDASCEASAPALRRRSLSKLRRRLSQTFRRSFGGSLADLGVQTFTIDEHEDEHSASLVGVSMNTGDGDSIVRTSGQRRSISEAKINGTVITIKLFIYTNNRKDGNTMDSSTFLHFKFLFQGTTVALVVLEVVMVVDFQCYLVPAYGQ